jgi:hypothetical protein
VFKIKILLSRLFLSNVLYLSKKQNHLCS